jgi:hypothetical protein
MKTRLTYIALMIQSSVLQNYDKKKKENKINKDNFFDNIHTILLKQDFYDNDISNKKFDMLTSTPENFEDFLTKINSNITAIYFGNQDCQKFLLDLFEQTQKEYQNKEKSLFCRLKNNLLCHKTNNNNNNAIVFCYNEEKDYWETPEEILSKMPL